MKETECISTNTSESVFSDELNYLFHHSESGSTGKSSQSDDKMAGKPGTAALCLSGGGIRSATFSLGVLQALAQKELIRQFDYLSTVSGGGFIGSWLSRWIKEEGNTNRVEQKLAREQPEAREVSNLRAHSSYLSPSRGLSRDGLTLAAIIIRNLLLTWSVLLPAIICGLLVPRLFLAIVTNELSPWCDVIGWGILIFFFFVWFGLFHYAFSIGQKSKKSSWLGLFPFVTAFVLCSTWSPVWTVFHRLGLVNSTAATGASYAEVLIFSILAIPLFLLSIFVLNGLIQGLISRWIPENLRERSSRNSSELLKFSLIWIVLAITVFLIPHILIETFWSVPAKAAAVGGVAGLITLAAGYLGQSGMSQPSESVGSWRRWSNIKALPVIAAIVLVVLAGMLSIGLSKVPLSFPGANLAAVEIKTRDIITSSTFVLGNEVPELKPAKGEDASGDAVSEKTIAFRKWLLGLEQEFKAHLLSANIVAVLSVIAVLISSSILLSWLLGVNRFSLHHMYGNRLVRAYLAASRSSRDPDKETGFDDKDNIAISLLDENRPLHIVNAALNLGSNVKPEWQSRKATSFTFSPLYSGSDATGYVASKHYTDSEGGVSLGKAMTISGAAVSPSMGYHSSKIVGALLTLFNVRLGWWLPNPRNAEMGKNNRGEPEFGFWQLLREFFSKADDKSNYVYLSDGGHFDNLGLYEMVKRRCRQIIVVDAGQDKNFEYENLSNAIRLIKVDFGIDITMDVNSMPGHAKGAGERVIMGRIGYGKSKGNLDGSVKDGVLIYIKPVLLGDEPLDVKHYANKKAKTKAPFPHESTADQFFDEAQFESYRRLGRLSGEKLTDLLGESPKLQSVKVPDSAKLQQVPESNIKGQARRGGAEGQQDEDRNPDRQLEKLSFMSDLFGQASNWVAPVVATTLTATAVMTVNHQLEGPPGGLKLNTENASISAPPIKLEGPDSSIRIVPPECAEEDTSVFCQFLRRRGQTGTGNPSNPVGELRINQDDLASNIGISQDDLDKTLRINPDDLAKTIQLDTEALQQPLRISTDDITDIKNAATSIVNADVTNLVASFSESVPEEIGRLAEGMENLTSEMNKLVNGVDGLRNDIQSDE